MARVEISLDFDYDTNLIYVSEMGKYSLSEEEYADYLAVVERYEEWQEKLSDLKPDDHVLSTGIELLEIRAEQERLQSDENIEALLDQIAPLP